MLRSILKSTRVMAVIIAGGLVFAAPNPGFAEEKKVKLVKAGTLEVKGGSVGFLIGFRWGSGILTLNNGGKLKFSFKGGKLLETGVASITAKGTVYNMKKVADFEGTYTGFSGGLTLGKELFGFVNLENARGVIISIKSENKGVRLSAPAPGGVTVSFHSE